MRSNLQIICILIFFDHCAILVLALWLDFYTLWPVWNLSQVVMESLGLRFPVGLLTCCPCMVSLNGLLLSADLCTSSFDPVSSGEDARAAIRPACRNAADTRADPLGPR